MGLKAAKQRLPANTMSGTPEAGDCQSAQTQGRPTGIKVLVAVNALAAIALLAMFPQYSGGRALLYLGAGILHGVLAFGLFRRLSLIHI